MALGLMLAAFLAAFLVATPIMAASALAYSVVDSDSRHLWSVSLGGERHHFKAGDGFEFVGNSGEVSFGYGYLGGRWFSRIAADLMIGPFDPSLVRKYQADYQGLGLKAWWGYSAEELDLRHPDGGYGFVLGLSYSEFTGQSLVEGQKVAASQSVLPERHSYALRIAHFAVLPGLFFCWLDPARPAGRRPAQLMTRVEGYLFTLAFAVPFFSSYQASYVQLADSAPSARSRGADPLGMASASKRGVESERVRAQGELKGFTILLSLTALFGG